MKMMNPEMEVVRFSAEDVIATSGDHSTNPLTCPNGHDGATHLYATGTEYSSYYHTTSIIGTFYSYTDGELKDPYTDKINTGLFYKQDEAMENAKNGVHVWYYKDGPFYYVCGSGQ